jgi:L-threonylcarbamoyladenylate synthase
MTLETEIQNALQALREGKTILYPTDTIWGIGCDATNEKAVEKIFQIKKRNENKSLITLVSDDGMLNRFVKEVPEMAWDLMDANNAEEDEEPGKPITIIYDAARGLAKNVLAEDGSIGIRLVTRNANDFCHRLIHKFGRPLVSTSANISGEPSPKSFTDISDEIKRSVDYVVNWKQNEHIRAEPSSIIRLKTNGEFVIIRE